MKKTITSILVGVMFVIAPLTVQASTMDDLRAQIASLLQMVTQLQQQLIQTERTTSTDKTLQCLTLKDDLWQGARGVDVGKLQLFLHNTGDYTYHTITKYYGHATKQAVQRYQQRRGIVSYGTPHTTGYGVVGPKTREYMRVCELVDHGEKVCTEEYKPVCGELKVQCIKAPCNPIQKTYGNKCSQEQSGATLLHEGRCLDNTTYSNSPYYFVAIHNEALPDPLYPEATLEKSYITLKEIIAKADNYSIKLTLMFNPQWVDYIGSDFTRLENLKKWKLSGHEIAAHHHSVKHPNWNGYTNTPENEAIELRIKLRKDHISEEYLGDMNDYASKLKKINYTINSGCVGKSIEMPDNFIYDTCSGFSNNGDSGQKLLDENPEKGINEYISNIMINGITRKYLAHAQITTEEALSEAKTIIESLDSTGVYGAVAHSIKNNSATGQGDAVYLLKYLDFLHMEDPQGLRSKTITEIIEGNILPEIDVANTGGGYESTKNAESIPTTQNGKCGDNVCDMVERNNPQICPMDCR